MDQESRVRCIRHRVEGRRGRPVQEIREGDVVRIPPGQKHWHGATATTRVTHIALHEQLAGKVVEWMEKVIDEQYGRR